MDDENEYGDDIRELSGRFYSNPVSARDPWPERLKSRALRAAQSVFGANDITWGDRRSLQIEIPNASTTAVLSGNPIQVVDVRESPRVWAVELNLAWTNPQTVGTGESPTAGFIIQHGVGRAKTTIFQNVAVTNLLAANSSIVAVLPAGSIYVTAAVSLTPQSGSARTYFFDVSVMCAPVFRP